MMIKNSITLGKQHSKPFLSVRFWSLLSLKRVQVGIGQSVFLSLFLFSLSLSASPLIETAARCPPITIARATQFPHQETTAPEALLAL